VDQERRVGGPCHAGDPLESFELRHEVDGRIFVAVVGRLDLGHVAVDAAESDLDVAGPGTQALDNVSGAALVHGAVQDRQDVEGVLGGGRPGGGWEQGQEEQGCQHRQQRSRQSHQLGAPEAGMADSGV
jgi:hypothetical protein